METCTQAEVEAGNVVYDDWYSYYKCTMADQYDLDEVVGDDWDPRVCSTSYYDQCSMFVYGSDGTYLTNSWEEDLNCSAPESTFSWGWEWGFANGLALTITAIALPIASYI